MSKNSEPTDYAAVDTPELVDAKGGSKRKLQRRWFRIAAVGITIVAAAVFWAGMSSPILSTRPLSGPSGASAINFTLPSVTSSHIVVTLRRFRARPLVINFWAS